MYPSQNSSFITLLRFEESSISEVLVCNCQCNIKTMQNPTNIDRRPLPKCARGLLLAREVTGSKSVGEECQNQLHSYCFAHFLIKIQKILDFFSFCFWVLTLHHEFKLNEQTRLNLVFQKIKKWIFFACLNIAFWLVTMKQQVCAVLSNLLC